MGSEGRLSTGVSERSGRVNTAMSRQSTAASSIDFDTMYDDMAHFVRKDHVSNIMQQPLPDYGHDSANYTKQCSVGLLPTCPEYLRVARTAAQVAGHHNHEYQDTCKAQKASEL